MSLRIAFMIQDTPRLVMIERLVFRGERYRQ